MEKSDQKAMLRKFDKEMERIYQRARDETGYNATRFFQMLQEKRGLETARYLLNSPKVSEGYAALLERDRLDLTVEAMVLKNKEWHILFSEEELNVARKRLPDKYHDKETAA